jgi:uncharacterized cupredoxin-like copper-binding protein
MQRKRLLVGVFGVCALGLVALGFGAATRSASARTAGHANAKVTTITVTMGKPSEFAFTLSRFTSIPVGKVTFTVTNKGAIGHSFKVCTKAVTTAKANACVGTATKVLNKGQSQTITVTLTKGKFEFICTVPGHASTGMKGLLGMGVSVSKDEAAGKTATTGGAAGGAGGAGGGAAATTCASPQTTTVTLTMLDFSFSGIPSTIPCGTITFTAMNGGAEPHNLGILTVGGGPVVAAGGTSSFTATLTPGSYNYQCDVPTHAGLGMVGRFTVT